jgi:hypothetical protein
MTKFKLGLNVEFATNRFPEEKSGLIGSKTGSRFQFNWESGAPVVLWRFCRLRIRIVSQGRTQAKVHICLDITLFMTGGRECL